MADLFADSDDSSEEIKLKTENAYAKKYDVWREKEELYKLEQKYGDNPTESTDSEDDDELPEVSEKMETDFLKTLSLLKNKDPRIYDPQYKFFIAEEGKKEELESTKGVEGKPKKTVSSLAAAFEASDDESDGEIFKVEKPSQETRKKEDKLKEYLTGKVEQLDQESEADLQPLKALWSDPKLSEGEAFLRDYILNKKYLEEDEGGPSEKLRDDAELEADEATVEEQGKFERAYNFRFEEPDREFLKRYPRTIGGTRPKDDRRARKRAEVRERKEAEKTRKMEEIGRLKALKLKEIQQKIEQIKNVTGNKELAFQEEDIEGDFDPSEHDRRMAAIFDEQYYGEQDTEKPVFPDLDDELEIENWDKYEEELGVVGTGTSQQHGDAPHCEDQDFNMDADYDPRRSRTTLMEEIKETLGKKRRNRKRRSKLAQLLAAEKPQYDPQTMNKTYAEYMEEYYKMDCEDVIGGDLPTRFKYREVVPNSYGLTIEEILLADDKELNMWVPLKKTVKYRPEHVERGEVKTYQLKANDTDLKKKILPSLFKVTEDQKVAEEQPKKKKKKKKNKSREIKKALEEPSTSFAIDNREISNNEHDIYQNKVKHQDNGSLENIEEVSIENNTVNVVKKKKKKNKHKNTEINEIVEDIGSDQVINNIIEKEEMPKIIEEVEGNTIKSSKKKNKKENNSFIQNECLNRKDKKLKRKLQFNNEHKGKKIKFNQPPQKDDAGLSDERLKAYGLNPKKYRNFLKHKKF